MPRMKHEQQNARGLGRSIGNTETARVWAPVKQEPKVPLNIRRRPLKLPPMQRIQEEI